MRWNLKLAAGAVLTAVALAAILFSIAAINNNAGATIEGINWITQAADSSVDARTSVQPQPTTVKTPVAADIDEQPSITSSPTPAAPASVKSAGTGDSVEQTAESEEEGFWVVRSAASETGKMNLPTDLPENSQESGRVDPPTLSSFDDTVTGTKNNEQESPSGSSGPRNNDDQRLQAFCHARCGTKNSDGTTSYTVWHCQWNEQTQASDCAEVFRGLLSDFTCPGGAPML